MSTIESTNESPGDWNAVPQEAYDRVSSMLDELHALFEKHRDEGEFKQAEKLIEQLGEMWGMYGGFGTSAE